MWVISGRSPGTNNRSPYIVKEMCRTFLADVEHQSGALERWQIAAEDGTRKRGRLS